MRKCFLGYLLAIWILCAVVMSDAFGVALERDFICPPASAKPHTWWHWMSGNVTKEGIKADLEAMKKGWYRRLSGISCECFHPRCAGYGAGFYQ